MKKLLVTGSGGLIGSETVAFFAAESAKVHGVDNNLRADFFGAPGDTSWKNPRVELHGFLSYFIKCNLEEKTYKIFGYKGKQVRDNIHSLDVVRFISEIYPSAADR